MIDLKSSSFTLPVLRLLGGDIDTINQLLSSKVSVAPGFFRHAPLVIDLNDLPADDQQRVNIAGLVDRIKRLDILPVGIRGGNRAENAIATALGLAVMAERHNHKNIDHHQVAATKAEDEPAPDAAESKRESANKPTEEADEKKRTVFIKQPVRSGQQIYASDSDLIVTAQVSAGAEVIADGNIHIYGALRGRALAGAKGDQESRIFCQDLDAELVSIAGTYQVSDSLDDSVQGKAVQIRLENGSLIISAM